MTPEHMQRLHQASEELIKLLSLPVSDATTAESHAGWDDANSQALLALVDHLLQVEMFTGLFIRTWLAVAYGAYQGHGHDLVIAWQQHQKKQPS